MAHRYRSDIDGLRAVSVLAVVLFHAGIGFPGGFVGVDVFFVISGFLITGLIRGGLESGEFSMARFWERRIRRILPASLVTTATTLAVGWWVMLPSDYRDLGGDAVAQTMMLANVRFWLATDYFASGSDLRPLLHTWSLAVEEQFYLVYPFLLCALWTTFRKSFLPLLTLLALCSFLLSAWSLAKWPAATFYLLPFRAWELQLGGLLAFVPIRWTLAGRQADLVASGGLLLVLACCFLYDRTTQFPGLAALPVCLGSCMVIFGAGTPGCLTGRLLGWRPLRYLGLVSYSLYLVHWPILAFLRYRFGLDLPLPLSSSAVLGSFVVAVASYRWIETPFRVGLQGWTFRQVAASAAIVSLGSLAVAALIRRFDGVPSRVRPDVAAFQAREAFPRQWDLDKQPPSVRCVAIGAPTREGSCPCFLVLGDSHGMAISEVIDDAARRRGVGGAASLQGAFPPLLGVWRPGAMAPGANHAQHEMFDRWLLNEIEHCPPQHVILVARWSAYLSDGVTDVGYGDRLQIALRTVDDSDSANPADVMERSLNELMQLAGRYGFRVWVLLEVPFQELTPQRRATLAMHGDELRLAGSSIAEHLARTAGVREAIGHLASDRLSVIDLAVPFYSADGSSRVGRPGISWYHDDDHVSASGAREVLAPLVDDMLERISKDCGTP